MQKRGYVLLPVILLAMLALVAAILNVSAVDNDGLFELETTTSGCPAPKQNATPFPICGDANTFDDTGAGAPYDWETICKATNLTTNRTMIKITPEPAGVEESSCEDDWTLPDRTTFATGSKDIGDIAAGGFVGAGEWACATDNNVLEKDEITNAYAALMKKPSDSHNQLYFGLERPSNNGTSFMGFWFLQSDADCLGPGPGDQGSNPWTGGLHVAGDLLMLSDFSGGGRISTLRVLQWNPSNVLAEAACTVPGAMLPDPVVGPLCQLASGSDCSVTPADDDVCGVVNNSDVTTPWWNEPRRPPCNQDGVQDDPAVLGPNPCTIPLESNQLFEGGVDLTAVLGAGLPCFSTFIAETRSSDTETADLKDFVRGEFEVCAANITITPDDVNEVNETHTFTIDADQEVFGVESPATDGTCVTAAIDSGPGSFVADSGDCDGDTISGNDCVTSGGTGQCTVTITSSVTGVTVVSACATVTIFGTDFFVCTDGTSTTPPPGDNSAPATKRWVDAKIEISPDGVNEVGETHTLTATVSQDKGDAAGFVAAPNGTCVVFSLTNSLGATATFTTPDDGNDCNSAGGNLNDCQTAAGSCSVTITSNTTGLTEIDATATFDIVTTQGTESVTRSTDGVLPNSDGALKRWVDASIAIAPLVDNNPVNTNHTLTATVLQNKGDGAGLVAAPNGTCVVFTLSNAGGATATFTAPDDGNNCGGTGSNLDDCLTSGGTCAVTITSPTTGTTTINAFTTFDIVTPQGTESVTRDTDPATLPTAGPGGSGPALKRWASAAIVTEIHLADHTVVTTVNKGTTVHDKATVSRGAGTPAEVPDPTGTVTFFWFTNGSCSGSPAATSNPFPLPASLVVESDSGGTPFTQTPNAPGFFAFQAMYNGDGNYPAVTSACEPLEVIVRSLVVPTQTECAGFRDGTATELAELLYGTGKEQGQSTGLIAEVNPGQFFYFTRVTVSDASDVIEIVQSSASAAFPEFKLTDVDLYNDPSCAVAINNQACNEGAYGSISDCTFNLATGSYIIRVRYDPSSISGTDVCLPAPPASDLPSNTYTFATKEDGVETTSDSVTLNPKSNAQCP